MGEDGARGKDRLRAWGASPVSYRHNFLVFGFLRERGRQGDMFNPCHVKTVIVIWH